MYLIRLHLTLVMLNRLRCHTQFKFSANPITLSRLMIQSHIINDSADDAAADLKKPIDLDLHYFQMQGMSGLSRTRVKRKVSGEFHERSI